MRHTDGCFLLLLVVGCSTSPSNGADGGADASADAPQSGEGGGSCGGSAAGILDATQAIDWTQAGVGGIPARTTACATVDASKYGNGTTDATADIQKALDACAAEQAVVLSAGKFLIATSLTVPAHVTLRGAGASQTILDAHGKTSGVVQLGRGAGPSQGSPQLAIASGATAGSTSLVLANPSGVAAGDYLIVSELNDASYVSIHGGEGDCTWCDAFWGGARARGQIVKVTALSGATATIAPPLYSAYGASPLAVPFQSDEGAGVESLQVYANNTGYTSDFYMSACASCFIRGVEANYTDGDFVQVHFGWRDEIRDSYFSNAFRHSPGTTDSDVFLASKTSATLVENNIIERAHVSVMLNWGAAGNVIAYNFMHGEFDTNATNAVTGGVSMHGAHPQFNLLEGNVAPKWTPDEIWGSSSHNTAFRNWMTGANVICQPTTEGARGTVDCSAAIKPFQQSRAMDIAHLSTHDNFVGNVVGSNAQNALVIAYNPSQPSPMKHVGLVAYPALRAYDDTTYDWTFGYGESSDDGTGDGCGGGTPPCHGTEAMTTAFMHGNYDHADGQIAWAPNVPQSLPCSMYLASKPAWWGDQPFPANGPDVTGGGDAAGHAYGNAAMRCYLGTMKGELGGAGGPLPFDAKTCY
jgi:hypothetical protein